MSKENTYKHVIYKNTPDTSTPITADTFNDIWNAIDCIDYRLRETEENNMNEFKIKHISRTIIQVVFMIVVFVNAIFIKSKWLSTFLMGFIVALLIDCIIDFIIADISSKKIIKKLDEMYKDDETYQRLFKR